VKHAEKMRLRRLKRKICISSGILVIMFVTWLLALPRLLIYHFDNRGRDSDLAGILVMRDRLWLQSHHNRNLRLQDDSPPPLRILDTGEGWWWGYLEPDDGSETSKGTTIRRSFAGFVFVRFVGNTFQPHLKVDQTATAIAIPLWIFPVVPATLTCYWTTMLSIGRPRPRRSYGFPVEI